MDNQYKRLMTESVDELSDDELRMASGIAYGQMEEMYGYLIEAREKQECDGDEVCDFGYCAERFMEVEMEIERRDESACDCTDESSGGRTTNERVFSPDNAVIAADVMTAMRNLPEQSIETLTDLQGIHSQSLKVAQDNHAETGDPKWGTAVDAIKAAIISIIDEFHRRGPDACGISGVSSISGVSGPQAIDKAAEEYYTDLGDDVTVSLEGVEFNVTVTEVNLCSCPECTERVYTGKVIGSGEEVFFEETDVVYDRAPSTMLSKAVH